MKAVILDMYGVILKDPGEGIIPFVQKTFPDMTPREIYLSWNRADIGEITSAQVFQELGFTGDLELRQREYLDSVEIFEDFFEFAGKIKKDHKLGLISNDSSQWSSYFRKKYDLNKYFDALSVSGDLKIKKPDKRIFNITLEKLGCTPEDCTYVDDRINNVRTALSMGMNAVLFNTANIDYEGNIVTNYKDLYKMIISQE